MAKLQSKTQSLSELAIFGSILLMLLGVLLNYGLKYNAQQQTAQEAQRKALTIAANSLADGKENDISVNYLVVKDKHIPDPANPFGLGSVVAVSAQASVTRDYRTFMTAANKDALPKIFIDVNNQEFNAAGEKRNYLYTAAFRDINNIPEGELYSEEGCDCNNDGEIDEDEEKTSKYDCVYGSEKTGWWQREEGVCACATEMRLNSNTGETEVYCPCYNIRITDDCAGEIVSYEAVKKRCAQIERFGIDKPWYCNDGEKEKLFAFSGRKMEDRTMGIQQDYSQTAVTKGDLKKQEDSKAITNTIKVDFKNIIERTLVYNDNVDESGGSKNEVNIIGNNVVSTLSIVTCEKGEEGCYSGYKFCVGTDCDQKVLDRAAETKF